MTVKDLLKSLKKPTLITINDHLDVGTVSSLNLNVNSKYFDREKISSGYQEINHSSATDLELQMKWKW